MTICRYNYKLLDNNLWFINYLLKSIAETDSNGETAMSIYLSQEIRKDSQGYKILTEADFVYS